jgi:hypothetical protein
MEIEKDMEYVYRASDMGQGRELEAKINKLVKSILMYNLNAKITSLFPIVREEWPYTQDILDRKGINKPQFLGELCGLGALEVTNKASAWWGSKVEMMCQIDRDNFNNEPEWQGDILLCMLLRNSPLSGRSTSFLCWTQSQRSLLVHPSSTPTWTRAHVCSSMDELMENTKQTCTG